METFDRPKSGSANIKDTLIRSLCSPKLIRVNPVRMAGLHAWIVLGTLLTVAVALAWASLLRHLNLDSTEDLAMFDQMLWNVRQGAGLFTSISGNSHLQFVHHFSGEHFSPILYLLAWPAGMTPGPEALLVIQAFAVALAAIPLWHLTTTLTGSKHLGTFSALIWLIQPALWGATLYDFHMEAFEGLFLFAFAHSFITGRWQAWLWGALYASCKEDAPLYLAALAFVLGWQYRRWRSGLAITLIAGIYGLAAVAWIVPSFATNHATLLKARLLTPAVCGGIWEWTLKVLLDCPRWGALASHLLALGLLPLIGGRLLLPAAMTVGVMWISGTGPQSLLMWHYPYTTHPLLVIAGISGLARLAQWYENTLSRLPAAGTTALQSRLIPWAPAACVSLLLATGLAMGWHSQRQYNREFTLGRMDAWGHDHREERLAMRAIPKDQSVAALLTLAPHLSRRQKVAVLFGGCDGDLLVLRTRGRSHPIITKDYHGWLDTLLSTNSGYGAVSPLTGEVIVLKRGWSSALNAEADAGPREVEAEDMRHGIGSGISDRHAQNGKAWMAGRGARNGYVIWGPHVRLTPGRYKVSFRVRSTGFKPGNGAVFDVAAGNGTQILAERTLDQKTSGYEWVGLEFTAGSEDVLEFRCFKKGRGTVCLDAVYWQRL